ncbi:uncharacterized protein LOC107485655 [Arachis duranensis]|uniref:Uncharacterized protein LOC107485655 n=1 Tax=Arachis duranensis TaxID=130453 RepID=A0A6P4D3Q7_ARADU|nr:uncharacterized protein LOC107485655 [Arachis duranensis]
MVLKIGPDRPVQPEKPGTGYLAGPDNLQNRWQRTGEKPVKPAVNRRTGRTVRFFGGSMPPTKPPKLPASSPFFPPHPPRPPLPPPTKLKIPAALLIRHPAALLSSRDHHRVEPASHSPMEQSQSNSQSQDNAAQNSQTGSSRGKSDPAWQYFTVNEREAEEEGEAPNPVQPPAPATMGDKGKRRAIAATPIGSYFKERTMPGSQLALKSVLASKQVKHKVKLGLARWIIDARIPFNAIQSPYFQPALDGVAVIGPSFKGPSYDEMRVHLLADLKKECQLLVEGYRRSWKRTGCTLMADGWTDQRQRTLINFLVYCPAGMSFVKSVDASDMIKTADTLFKLFDEVIEWVGSSNIVHVVTDNAANYVSAGKLIHEKYPNIFWSPCAAHCINLILKDIASLPHIADLASRASKVTVFVYNHMIFLSWLRKRKEWKEIVRPGVTRFATVFITLKSIYDHKQDLQALVIDKYFTSHKLSKSVNGKMVSSIILDSKFWEDCFTTVMLVGPLIKLLRLVDADEKPSLGIVYAGMQRAKINIKTMFRNRKSAYTPYTSILKMRWDKHLKRDLHAAAYFLNPDYFYSEGFVEKANILRSLLDLFDIETLCDDSFAAMQEIQLYRDRKGSFGRESEWWRLHGGSAPNLQKMAIHLLHQTSSSSGCERNWSLFEQIHSKRRNRLEHQRLSDIVYVTYNLRLQSRMHRKKKNYDPIDIQSIDTIDFWVMPDEEDPEFSNGDIEGIENLIYTDNAMPSYPTDY